MKKLLSIMVLSMLYCNISFANILLNCQSYDMTFTKEGVRETTIDTSSKIVFKIDLSKKKIFELTEIDSEFEHIEDYVMFTDSKIKWSSKGGIFKTETFNSINRITGEYIYEVFYSKESPLKELAGTYSKSTYKCLVDEKKF
jgi:hypothetical protein